MSEAVQIADISIRFCMRIPFVNLVSTTVSYDHARLNQAGVINPVGRTRYYPEESLQTPTAHLAELVAAGQIGNGLRITQTYRNCYQHLRCPLYSRENGICQSSDEEVNVSKRPYYGIAHLDDGTLQVLSADFRNPSPIPSKVKFWTGGVPVLWDNKVSDSERLLAAVYDPRHLWQGLKHEDIGRLQKAFHDNRHHSEQEAAQNIRKAAQGLPMDAVYLHNAVAVSGDSVFLIMVHGKLGHVGELAKALGASHCIVVDNGGSCQIAQQQSNGSLRSIVQSHYFREPTLVLAVYELNSYGEEYAQFGRFQWT